MIYKPLSSLGIRAASYQQRLTQFAPHVPLESILGNYRIHKFIGRGGFGEVYEARHITIQQMVALKVYVAGDKEALDAFTRGVSLLAQLRNPNIVKLHDFFIQDNMAVEVMELFDPDSTLRRLVGTFVTHTCVAGVLPILTGLVQALRYCHNTRFRELDGSESIGIYHGDIKPDNVFISDGRAILADFMVPNLQAFLEFRKRREEFPIPPDNYDSRAFGTPMYMSPEQSKGGKLSEQSDIYSFGVTAFELLTGFYPYETEGDFKAQKVQLVERFNPYCAAWLSRIIHKCISHDLEIRYSHAATIERDLLAGSLGRQEELTMDPITAMSAIGSALGLTDKFVDLVRKLRKGDDMPHNVETKREDNALVIKKDGAVVERIDASQLRLDQWDAPRFEALRSRTASLWGQYNGLYANLPSLSVDEKVRVEQRMEQMRQDLCQDFREMIGISERVLGISLADHYLLYKTCSDGM
jgi:serine/threonine protein kinase